MLTEKVLVPWLRVLEQCRIVRILLLAVAYLATAKLGLLLSIPTIYASPFWPAAGLALAALLVFGYRAWPGVFIGCLALNLGTVSVAAAAGVAAGASVQALAGAFLIRRFLGFPSPLDNARDVVKFMLLGGPLSSWVSATCGVSTLVWVGFIPADDFAFNWRTWWIGDSIGVLVVAPLVIVWLGKPIENWRHRRVWVTVPVCLAAAIAVAFFVRASGWEQDRIKAQFQERAGSIGDALKTSANRYLEVLESARDLHASSTALTWPEFRTFVTGPLARYPGIQAISWNPRILDSARPEQEKGLRRDGYPDTGIMERDIKGRLIPAARRNEYVFVRFIEPYDKNRAALGYDVASDLRRGEALNRAGESGWAVATAQIELVQDVRREPGVLVFVPVYRNGAPIGTQEQRRANLLGYMTGVFRIPDVVASSVKDLQGADLDLVLQDASAAAGERPLYSNRPVVDDEQSTWARITKATMAKDIEIHFGERRWVLSVLPTWAYVKKHRSWQAWTMLATGMFFSGLIGAFLLVITGGSARLRGLADRLQLEATERSQAEEKVRRLNRVYAVLSGINALLVRVRNREELYRDACRIVVEAGRFPLAWIGVLDPASGEILRAASSGDDKGLLGIVRLSANENDVNMIGVTGRALLEGKPVIINDVARHPGFPHRNETLERQFRSFAALPIRAAGHALLLCIYSDEPGFFDEQEIHLLTELAGDISFAIGHIEKSERLDYLAYYDALTGLANRALFQERLAEHARTADQGQDNFAVCVFDVDRFKAINDACGRQIGDALLRQIAARMVDASGDPGRLGRINADRFALILPSALNEGDVARRIRRQLNDCFARPFKVQHHELRISAKAGIALFPSDGTVEEALFASAEAALKKAKTTGDGFLFHTPEMTERIAEKLSLENKLRQALENDEFVLHYQPKVSTVTRRVQGVEALIRWQSPEFGLVSPMQFIPLLEETGLILEVGAWALRQAVSDRRDWLARGLRAPRIAVNISAFQLRQRDFVAVVSEAIGQNVTPHDIDLEITESLLMDNIADNIEKLKALRALGVGVAIDDFGTGHSSLAYLAKLPVDTLKIDRSFIITMLEHPDTMTLVQTIISLAHSLKLKVVAEGVDSDEQAAMLRLLRCDQMQGFLFSKPLTAARLTEYLANHDRGEVSMRPERLSIRAASGMHAICRLSREDFLSDTQNRSPGSVGA